MPDINTSPTIKSYLKSGLRLQVAGRHDIGLRKKVDQDRVFWHPTSLLANDMVALAQYGFLYAVADGVSKGQQSEKAAELTCTSLPALFYSNLREQVEFYAWQPYLYARTALNQAILEINRSAWQQAQRSETLGATTTLVCALIQGQHALIAHVGDSRAYLYRPNNEQHFTQLHKLTRDHTWAEREGQELVQQGLLTEQQLRVDSRRHKVTQIIGYLPELERVDFTVADLYTQSKFSEVLRVQAGDWLLLCTDGLWDMAERQSPALLEEWLAQAVVSKDPAKATDILIQQAKEAGGKDNIGLVLIYVAEVDSNAPEFGPLVKAVAPTEEVYEETGTVASGELFDTEELEHALKPEIAPQIAAGNPKRDSNQTQNIALRPNNRVLNQTGNLVGLSSQTPPDAAAHQQVNDTTFDQIRANFPAPRPSRNTNDLSDQTPATKGSNKTGPTTIPAQTRENSPMAGHQSSPLLDAETQALFGSPPDYSRQKNAPLTSEPPQNLTISADTSIKREASRNNESYNQSNYSQSGASIDTHPEQNRTINQARAQRDNNADIQQSYKPSGRAGQTAQAEVAYGQLRAKELTKPPARRNNMPIIVVLIVAIIVVFGLALVIFSNSGQNNTINVTATTPAPKTATPNQLLTPGTQTLNRLSKTQQQFFSPNITVTDKDLDAAFADYYHQMATATTGQNIYTLGHPISLAFVGQIVETDSPTKVQFFERGWLQQGLNGPQLGDIGEAYLTLTTTKKCDFPASADFLVKNDAGDDGFKALNDTYKANSWLGQPLKSYKVPATAQDKPASFYKYYQHGLIKLDSIDRQSNSSQPSVALLGKAYSNCVLFFSGF